MLSRQTLLGALICFVCSSLCLLGIIIWPLIAVGVLAGVWRLRVAYGYGTMPKAMWVRLGLLPAIVLTLWLSQSMSRFEMIINLVMLGYSLKFIEIHKARDIQAFVLTGVMLLGLSLVFHSQIGYSLLVITMVGMHLLLLHSLSGPVQWQHGVRLARWNLAALPLMAVLFMLLPRLSPLWNMPAPTSAQTGLSDRVSPGDISRLIRSDKLVFRADMSTMPSALSEQPLYWRAMALDQFDGRQWTASAALKQVHRFAGADNQVLGRYSVLTEASSSPWVATLDTSLSLGGRLRPMVDRSWQRVGERFLRAQFDLAWVIADSRANPTPNEIEQARRLPEDLSADVQALALELIQGQSAEQPVDALGAITAMRQWFVSNNFRYTLTPPAYLGDSLQQFLFEGRQGFCAHYAQAAVVLLRLNAIPARMVTGYLGGEWQDDNTTVSVREFDAHAWVELWDGQKWLRLDPTSWIVPDRLSGNLQESLATAEQWQQIQPWMQRLWYSGGLTQMRLWLAKADYWWARSVVNFDRRKQMALMEALLGHLSLVGKVAVLASLIIMALLASLLVLRLWRKPKRTKAQRQLHRALMRLQRSGFVRQPGETLAQFAKRLEQESEQTHPEFQQQVKAYYRSRFQQGVQ